MQTENSPDPAAKLPLRNAVWRRGTHLAARLHPGQRDKVRRDVYELLEAGGDDFWSRFVEMALVALILINIAGFVLETVPSIQSVWGGWLRLVETVSVLIFTVEYGLRLWSCVELPFLRRLTPGKARWKFATRAPQIIDFLAISPFYLSFLLPVDLRLLRSFRLLRFLKLARYSPAMHTLVRVLANEHRALAGALVLVLTALLFAASGMYFLESEAQPNTFGSIPQAAWWAIVTLTTVGYGDVTPITPLGRVFAGLVMLCGLVVLALPIAIIATGFSQEANRRDFVLTWNMLSKIPLFADLDVTTVAELMRYLRAHNYPSNWEILQPGTSNGSMYFIASGRIRRHQGQEAEELAAGQHFGAQAVLDQLSHEHGYSTVTRSRVLELHHDDFLRLNSSHPEVCRRIRALAGDGGNGK